MVALFHECEGETPVQDSGKGSEWYTLPKYIEAARDVMGGIDLDPASCAAANRIVRATRYYAKEENGLAQPWSGRVWLNPPYGRTVKQQGKRQSTIGLFIEKLLQFYGRGEVTQAIVLVTTEVNARWFYPLWQFPVCIPDHRVHFLVPGGTHNGKYNQMFGTCFVYLGPDVERFVDVFSQFGHVVGRLSPARERIENLKLWE